MKRIIISVVALLANVTATFAQTPAPVVEYYHLDALGSVRAVTNAAGTLVRRHDYAPFGEELATVVGADQIRFVGKERDPETGLDNSMARFYGAKWGRFTTVDPGHVGGNIFDPQSWNAYGYARNNPLRFVDPLGTAYYVAVDGGSPFWINNDGELWKYKIGGFRFEGGYVLNAAGDRVGSYVHFDDFALLAADIAYRSKPAEAIAAAGVVFMAGAGIAAGGSAIAGTAGTGFTLHGAAQAAMITLPAAGSKLSQMMARAGGQFRQNPVAFLTFARNFVSTAIQQGSYRFVSGIGGSGATVYKVGNDYMVIARDGRILSYVSNATPGTGIVTTFMR